jgi:hypothetical protein
MIMDCQEFVKRFEKKYEIWRVGDRGAGRRRGRGFKKDPNIEANGGSGKWHRFRINRPNSWDSACPDFWILARRVSGFWGWAAPA